MTVMVDLGVIAALFVLAVLFTYSGPRGWMLRCGQRLAARYGRPEHTPEWEREHAELWLMVRRRQLQADLRRIEQLLRHDETMSATRQLGNRLARDQLHASLARIPDLLPADRYGLSDPLTLAADVAAPNPAGRRAATSVEVLDVIGLR